MSRQTKREKRVWDLLTQDFWWEIPTNHPVSVYDPTGRTHDVVRLQVFELAITTILATLCPDFVWRVTPNWNDRGLDFQGEHSLLEDVDLGIAATIKIGGQCKKRETVGDVLDVIAGSIIKMADVFDPTFFVFALSARVSKRRIATARRRMEGQLKRHCHILDRDQIEGLIVDHLPTVTDLLRAALGPAEVKELLDYFADLRRPVVTVAFDRPDHVPAGEPFRVAVDVASSVVANAAARLWWRPAREHPGDVLPLAPLGVDAPAGVPLRVQGAAEDPLRTRVVLEFVTYAVGIVDLGDVIVGFEDPEADPQPDVHPIGVVTVLDNMRPRFFAAPFTTSMQHLRDAYKLAQAGGVRSVAIVGPGGSGKSRLGEEFALESRGQGAQVVQVKQLNSPHAPYWFLAELLCALAGSADGPDVGDPADAVMAALERYDRTFAQKAEPAVRALFDSGQHPDQSRGQQAVISALVLLVVAHTRRSPLILHLQNLHWSSRDVLLILERLISQLDQILSPARVTPSAVGRGVLLLFEGRVRESSAGDATGWISTLFETFVDGAVGTKIHCRPFAPPVALEFVHFLFESRQSTHRQVPSDLLALQEELIERIDRAAGGNPFHTLEHIRMLKDLDVIGQNPKTGMVYLSQPEPPWHRLPESVFDSIRQRWEYLQVRAPALALLLRGCALLEDQIPAELFRHLWQELAPAVSVRDVDATDMIWTDDGRARVVAFRHENYFDSLQRLGMSRDERRKVAEAYCNWYAALRRPSATDRFRWARAVLELPVPDERRARALLRSAAKAARRQGAMTLARRIAAFELDVDWRLNEQTPLPHATFLRRCDADIDLSRDLLASDRPQARDRLTALRARVGGRLSLAGSQRGMPAEQLERRELYAEMVFAQLLFNDRRPGTATEIAERVVRRVRELRARGPADEPAWEALEMEALYTYSVAAALSGEGAAAFESGREAAELAFVSPSPLARKVVSTYGVVLLWHDPAAGEALLRDCLARWPADDTSDAFLVEVHLTMALVLQAHRAPDTTRAAKLLDDARGRLTSVFAACRRLELFPDAAAAALMLGIVTVVSGDDGTTWFAQAVAAAVRGGQMETLWRSHLNLATALHARDGEATPAVRDHALSAFKIMQETLSPYAQPEASPRFAMLAMPLADAVRFLIEAGDPAGRRALEQFPALRAQFRDPAAGVLRSDEELAALHQHLVQVGGYRYVLY